MAKYNNEITWHLKTQLEESGITKLINSLKQVETVANRALKMPNADQGLKKAIVAAKELQKVVNQSFNTTTGAFSVQKFNEALNGRSLTSFNQALSKTGVTGQRAFNDVLNQVTKVNAASFETSKTLEKIANTAGNTVRWGIMASAFQNITGEIQHAFGYIKELDTSLNGIRIVTDKSAESMGVFAKHANESAKLLGGTTVEYVEASRIFFEQGLSDEVVKARADTVVKAAHVAGQTTEEMALQMTGIWNGYQVATQDTEKYADKMAAIAAYSASNFEELSKAINKVASVANATGVSFDQLNAMIGTTISVTKQAPESIGVAYKTIFARLADLKATGTATDETGFAVGLGQISTQLQTMGVEILDSGGQLKDMGAIIDDVGAKWQTWTRTQQVAAAEAMAGKRQYNNLVALFDNWNMYTQNLNSSMTSFGALTNQNNIYMDSMEQHMNRLKTAKEGLYSALLDSESINTVTEDLAMFIETFTSFVNGIGGGSGVLLGAIALLTKAFRVQLGGAIESAIFNAKMFFDTIRERKATTQMIAQMSIVESGQGANLNGNAAAEKMLFTASRAAPLFRLMSEEQRTIYGSIINQTQEMYQQQSVLKENNALLVQNYNERLNAQKGWGVASTFAKSLSIDKQTSLGQEAIGRIGGKLDKGAVFQLSADAGAATQAVAGITKQLQLLKTDGTGAFNAVSAEVRELMGEFLVLPSLTDKERESVGALMDAFDKAVAKGDFTKAKASLAALGGEVDAVSGDMTKFSQVLSTVDLDRLKAEAESTAATIKTFGQSVDGFFARLEAKRITTAFTNLASNMMMLGFSLQSLAGIGTIWSDESLNKWDKGVQVMSAVSMGLMGLLPMFPMIGSAVTALGITIAGSTAIATAGISLLFAGVAALAVFAMAQSKKAEEAAKKAQEAAGKANDAYRSFVDLQKQYDEAVAIADTTEGKKKLLEVTESLIDATGDESLRILALSGNYYALTGRLKEHNKELATVNKYKAVEALSATLGTTPLEQSATPTPGGQRSREDGSITVDAGATLAAQGTPISVSETEKALQALIKQRDETSKTGKATGEITARIDELTKKLAALKPALDAVVDTSLASFVSDTDFSKVIDTDTANAAIGDQALTLYNNAKGALTYQESLALLYATMAGQKGVAADVAQDMTAYAQALETGTMKTEDLNKTINSVGWDNFKTAVRWINDNGLKFNPENLEMALDKINKSPKLKAKIKIEMDKESLAKAEAELADAQAKVEDAQKKVNDAAKKWGKDSGTYHVALRNLKDLKDKLIEAKKAYIQATLVQNGFSDSASMAAAAVLAVGKKAAATKLTSLKNEISSAVGYFNQLTTSAVIAGNAIFQAARKQWYLDHPSTTLSPDRQFDQAQNAGLGAYISDLKSQAAAIRKGLSLNLTSVGNVSSNAGSSTKKKKGKDDLQSMDKLKSEFDMYYNINKEIENLANSYNKLAKAQERLTGKALTDNLNAQLRVINKQIDAEERKQTLQRKEQKTLQDKLKKSGAKFDSEGELANYSTIVKMAENRLNAEIDSYNKKKTKKSQDKQELRVKAAENTLKALRENISKYDTLMEAGIGGTSQAIADLQAKMVELSIQKFSISLDISTDFAETNRKWNEFKQEVIDNKDMDKALNKIELSFSNLGTYLNKAGNANLNKVTGQLQEVNREIELMKDGQKSAIFGDDMVKAVEMRDKLLNQLQDGLTAYKTLIDDIKKSTVDWVSQTSDSFAKVTAQFDFVGNTLRHQGNLIKLMYGEKAYSEMDNYYDALNDNTSAQITFLRQQVNGYQAARDKINKVTDPELWDALNLKMQENQTSLNSMIESSAENLVAKYTNSINQILETFESGLTGGLGIDKMAEDWTMINKNADVYLDKTLKSYSINQLQSKVIEAINGMTDTSKQAEINSMMGDQLAMLREKDNLTQRDVDRANQLFDIELKRAAFEDAQNNKTKMSLTRDSQGNMSYVYSADKAETAKAKQDLADAEKALYEADKKAYADSLNSYQETFKAYMDKVRAIALNTTMTDSERVAEKATLDAQYGSLLQKQADVNATAKQNYAGFGDDPRAKAALQVMIDKITASGGFGDVSSQLWTDLASASQEYAASITDLQKTSGTDFSDIDQNMASAAKTTDSLALAGSNLVTTMNAEASAIANVVAQLRDYQSAMQGAVNLAGNTVGAAVSSAGASAGAVPNATSTITAPDFDSTFTASTTSALGQLGVIPPADSAGLGEPGEAKSAAEKKIDAAVAYANGTIGKAYSQANRFGPNSYDCSGLVYKILKTAGIYGGGAFTTANEVGSLGLQSGEGKDMTIRHYRANGAGHTAIKIKGKWYNARGKAYGVTSDAMTYGNAYHIQGYDTGGYTGEGNPNGHLAVLHPKEIVLNQSDTKNLLVTVSAVRDLAYGLKAGAMASAAGLVSTLGTGFNPGNKAEGVLKQDVVIKAEFPNVKDSKEIENALNNLVNTASQYAYKPKID